MEPDARVKQGVWIIEDSMVANLPAAPNFDTFAQKIGCVKVTVRAWLAALRQRLDAGDSH